ncbi:MAG: thymidylate synthase [bacterium]
MKINSPLIIEGRNLSVVWAKAFLAVYDGGGSIHYPFCISIQGFEDNCPVESSEVMRALDAALAGHEKHKCSIDETAATIFPVRRPYKTDPESRQSIYSWYLDGMIPRLKKRSRLNRYGTYFERMIAFEGINGSEKVRINQLEHIIGFWNERKSQNMGVRRSAMQVSCFDPARDHTRQPQRGFPCLQQIGFCYDKSGGLLVSAFYPTQYIFDRAYGNYLGICQLGAFMARSMDLELTNFTCFVACPELGTTKRSVSDLADYLRKFVELNNNHLDGSTT